ncbi:HupE/UreJ family protein [Flavihumibacter profundi]|uniref:HupE/UreJ family protein n=1 Tax=Flavihumibacter profundi TaxID=2716883 RepID=UPI001CC79EA4|nr:HupE/UreJ family protein [Flavihumibacter profundi]MBZ5856545.1 HupE/UreJ family protein [Flavihumibacter profundi]
MQEFNLYFGLGIDHILTWSALDHILFVSALCLRYRYADWRKVAIMVTAFTIGHSLTLALSVFGLIRVPVAWIEFLIPLTIAGTALNNLLAKPGQETRKLPIIYFFALFFGMIHGMAYANLLLDLEGTEQLPGHLLAFNLGIEVAQLVVVAVVLTLSFIFVDRLKLAQIWWLRVISVLILLFSIKLAVERIPELYTHTQTAITK